MVNKANYTAPIHVYTVFNFFAINQKYKYIYFIRKYLITMNCNITNSILNMTHLIAIN